MARDAMLGSSAFGLSQGLQQDRQRGLSALNALQGMAGALQMQNAYFVPPNQVASFNNCIFKGVDRAAKKTKTKTKTLVAELQADVDEWLPKL